MRVYGGSAVITSLQDWTFYLRDASMGIALPLIICGIGLMFFGWRLWKLCVVLSFALIGMYLTYYIFKPAKDQMLYVYLMGGLIGGAMYWPAKQAIAILGGVIVAIIVMVSVSNMRMTGSTLWSIGGAALIVGTAYAFLNRQHVVIMVTAFLGSTLVISGLTALIMASPEWLDFFSDIMQYSGVALPFILLVPTVMSCFYQLAEVKRMQIEFN